MPNLLQERVLHLNPRNDGRGLFHTSAQLLSRSEALFALPAGWAAFDESRLTSGGPLQELWKALDELGSLLS